MPPAHGEDDDGRGNYNSGFKTKARPHPRPRQTAPHCAPPRTEGLER
jgi:hypothetical protein